MKTTLELENLENVLRKIVREVMREEMMKLLATLLPEISNDEQKDVEALYRKPTTGVKRTIEIDL